MSILNLKDKSMYSSCSPRYLGAKGAKITKIGLHSKNWFKLKQEIYTLKDCEKRKLFYNTFFHISLKGPMGPKGDQGEPGLPGDSIKVIHLHLHLVI